MSLLDIGMAVAGALGVVALCVGFRGRLVDRRQRCAKCRFDLTGIDVGRCPECGRTLGARGVRSGRRRRRWSVLLIGIVLLLSAGTWGGLRARAALAGFDYRDHAPVWWLLREVRSDQEWPTSPAMLELIERHDDGSLSQGQIDRVARGLVACHERTAPYAPTSAFGLDWLLRFFRDGVVSDGTRGSLVDRMLDRREDTEQARVPMFGRVVRHEMSESRLTPEQRERARTPVIEPRLVLGGVGTYAPGQTVPVYLRDRARAPADRRAHVGVAIEGLRQPGGWMMAGGAAEAKRGLGSQWVGVIDLPKATGQHRLAGRAGYAWLPDEVGRPSRWEHMVEDGKLVRDGSPRIDRIFDLEATYDVAPMRAAVPIPEDALLWLRSIDLSDLSMVVNRQGTRVSARASGYIRFPAFDEPHEVSLTVGVQQRGAREALAVITRSYRKSEGYRVDCVAIDGMASWGSRADRDFGMRWPGAQYGGGIASTRVGPVDLVVTIDRLVLPARGIELENVGVELVFADRLLLPQR